MYGFDIGLSKQLLLTAYRREHVRPVLLCHLIRFEQRRVRDEITVETSPEVA